MKLGQKFVKKFVGFLGDLKTPKKIHSEINWPLVRHNFGISHDRCTRAEKLQCVLSIEESVALKKRRCISKFFNLFVTFLLSFSTPDFESVHLIKLIKELGNPSLQKVTKLALNKNSTLVKKKKCIFKYFNLMSILFAMMPKFEC